MKTKSFIKIISAVALSVAVINNTTFAAPFIPGNIVVTQYGDGSAALSSTSAPVFVLEYLPSTAGQAIPVQTIAISTNGPNRLTVTGNSGSEGFIARSVNSSNVTFIGYDASLGTNAISGTTGAGNNRVIGQLDFNGNFTRIASGSATAYSGSNIRSAASDGTNYWTSGTASTSANGGIWYSASGGAWTQIGTGNVSGNIRVTKIFNGNLYLSTGSGTIGVWAYNGIPTSTALATNIITTTPAASSPYDFAISPAGNVAYINDDAALAGGGATGGGIQKWTLNGSTWTRSFTMGLSNSLTAGCRGMTVDFSGPNPVIYATTADAATKLIKITDTSAFAAITNVTDQAVTLAVAPTNTAFRGVAFAPPSTSTGTAPVIIGISPTSATVAGGTTNVFTLTGGAGYPTASNFWYKISGGTTNLISGATAATLTLTNVSPSDTAGYFAILTNVFGSTTSSVASLTVSSKPIITGIAPASTTNNAGSTVTFTLTSTPGNPVASNFWYKIVGSATNLVSGATGTTFTLTNVLGKDTANYFAILTNLSGSATSAVVSLTVIGDPNIVSQPVNEYGLLDGTVQFTVTAAGTSPGYRWYFSDASGNIIAPVGNVTQGSGSVISGATTSTLTITNLQFADPTNFVVVVTNAYGSLTSSVASLISVQSTAATLAFWNFNGPAFTNVVANPNCVNNPVPYVGTGFAQAVGSCYLPGPYPFTSTSFSPFSGSVDANDGNGFGLGGPPYFSWGTDQYPASGGNKQNGVQFSVSTAGAKNIKVSYQSRVSATASNYERLQYTTNGTVWIDYPSSSTFGGVGTTYLQYNYDLTGYPGVANNPNFAVRVVTELQSTATYGVSGNANYVGTANTYGTTGTVTYDLVNFTGDAITNNNAPPVIAGFTDATTADFTPVGYSFSVSDDTTPLDQLTLSAVSMNPSAVNGNFAFSGTGSNRVLIITVNSISQSVAAAPILVTATDTNGDSAAAWFILTVTSQNLPPTNSLVSLPATNILANSALTIPFTVGDDRTTNLSLLSYSVSSDNNTLVPTANIVVTPNGAHPTVTITPAANQLGVAVIGVTVSDNDSLEPKSTTANIAFMVRPNTNVVAVDYFDYDNGGALDTASGGFWTHLSGNFGQMKFNSGVVTVDTLDNSENLQTSLLGAPYKTNSGALYSSFIVNMNDPARQPLNNGTYFSAFNDGSGNTANVEDCLVVATNGAAPGFYRLGIANLVGGTALTAQMFPQDLIPGINYAVVTALSLTNGFSTLWVNPGSMASPSISDTTAHSGTNLFNISDFELRESGGTAGSISVSYLKVGTTFDSVFPLLTVQPSGTKMIVNWSDPTLGIQSTTNLLNPFVDVAGATPPYTNNASTNSTMFFRFGQ